MKYATPRYNHSSRINSGHKFGLNRALLPNPIEYLIAQGMKPKGSGLWRDLVCPFHDDSSPSLRINSERGGYKCMAYGKKNNEKY